MDEQKLLSTILELKVQVVTLEQRLELRTLEVQTQTEIIKRSDQLIERLNAQILDLRQRLEIDQNVTKHHDDRYCHWKMSNSGTWTCEHGFTRTRHPNGYCDGGCCR